MKILLLALLILTTACAPRLGVHVHRFTHNGQVYFHCTVYADERDSNLAHSALQICQDAVEGKVPAYQHDAK
jgi:hypothetical protein